MERKTCSSNVTKAAKCVGHIIYIYFVVLQTFLFRGFYTSFFYINSLY